jgi:hypothetical protein
MPAKKHSDEAMLDALQRCNGIREEAARMLGMTSRSLLNHIGRLSAAGVDVPRSGYDHRPKAYKTKPEFELPKLPSSDIPIEERIALRTRQFSHKKDYEESSKLIPVKVKISGPIGLLHFGDPHVDDDGTDIAALERHTELVNETEGLFACNVGDTINNWAGRLARLYAEQSTSASQAWLLAEWFIGRCPWLYMIAGNHDLWSGAGDPLKWIARQSNTMYKSSEARIALKFPNGLTVRVNARHDHSGSSIWNPAHGPMKAAMLGTRDHIYVAGHKHESAYSVLKDPQNGITMHALKVASYKVYDRYSKEHGFRDNAFSPCAVTVINTKLPEMHPDLIKVFWDPEEGAAYLSWLRKRG